MLFDPKSVALTHDGDTFVLSFTPDFMAALAMADKTALTFYRSILELETKHDVGYVLREIRHAQ